MNNLFDTPVINKQSLAKFDISGPRYTSYPTVPAWSAEVDSDVYAGKLKAFGQTSKTLSLYVHLPFCQSLCSFCACNVVIRPNSPKYADEYLDHLFKEIDLVRQTIGAKKSVKQLHWGGGTPTFLTSQQMTRLWEKLSGAFDIDPQGEIAIEIDPRAVTLEKLETLRRLGFNRVSMGVQDFDPRVQEAVNRLQPFEMVERVYHWCRDLNFHSINFDFIYGLPWQTQETFHHTVEKILDLRPDRIALYSFAYLPWVKRHQKKIAADALPSNEEKLEIFLSARERLTEQGYLAIAMDHFALKEDELARAFGSNRLYRNFMGYTTKPADEFIGLGQSAIGFLQETYVQNVKTIGEYYNRLEGNRLPVERGKILSTDDRLRQWVIHQLMCHFQLQRDQFFDLFQKDFDDYFQAIENGIATCERDGLIQNDEKQITVTPLGKIFIRNICMVFDHYLPKEGTSRQFSRTV